MIPKSKHLLATEIPIPPKLETFLLKLEAYKAELQKGSFLLKLEAYKAELKAYEDKVRVHYKAELKAYEDKVRVQYTDESIIASQRKQLEIYRAALAPFADLIPASMHGLPEGTKFTPKLTLAPFVAAHKALYGTGIESP